MVNQIPEVRTTPRIGGLPSSALDPSSLIRQNLPGAARTSPAPAQLSLSDAIQLALQNNLATLSASEQRREASGFVQQARSQLLPNISGAAYQANLTINLAALGFQGGEDFPDLRTPSLVHSTTSTHGQHWSKTFSTSALFVTTSQAAREYASPSSGNNSRANHVAEATALTYLETLRSERNVAAAQANVTLAEALLRLAQDQHTAGVATGIDVTRAEMRLAQERVDLAQAETAAAQARLMLRST